MKDYTPCEHGSHPMGCIQCQLAVQPPASIDAVNNPGDGWASRYKKAERANELMHSLSARLAAVEAERDKQAEQIAMLLTICPNCAGLMAPEPPDSGCSGVYCPECRSDSAELRAERDRLKAALTLLWREVVASGNAEAANHGWPEAKRAVVVALTTQHQPSTDGETR